jgi:hypothetical protein
VFSGFFGFLGILEPIYLDGAAACRGPVLLVQVLVVEEFGYSVFKLRGCDFFRVHGQSGLGAGGVCFEFGVEELGEFFFVVLEVAYVYFRRFLRSEEHLIAYVLAEKFYY